MIESHFQTPFYLETELCRINSGFGNGHLRPHATEPSDERITTEELMAWAREIDERRAKAQQEWDQKLEVR